MAVKKQTKATKKSTSREYQKALGGLGPSAGVTPPSIPVLALIGDAHDLWGTVKKHRAALKEVMRDPTPLEIFEEAVQELEAAQKAWREVRKHAEGIPEALRNEAETWRGDIIAAGRYFCEEDADAQSELDDIAAGDSLEDLVMDLDQLVGFVTRHATAFRALPLEGGATRAKREMTARAKELRAARDRLASDSRAEAAIDTRNRAALLVTRLMATLRAAGRFALRDNPRALKELRSSYYAATNATRKQRTPEVAPV